MPRRLKSILIIPLFLFFCVVFVFAEEVMVTTYYPSPYGSYNQLQTSTLGVGDNDGVGGLTSADVPNPVTNPGDVWIKGDVGIGTTLPVCKLDVVGTVNATAYQVGATPGISKVIDVGACTVTVTNGIITATTC